MIQSVKITAIVALLVSGAVELRADQTNLVQNLNIRLTGITQGRTETNGNFVRTSVDFARVGNSDVIKQLGTATGNSFSSKAKLVVVTPLPSGNSAIMIRDGTASVDVTSFFVYEQKGGFVTSSQTNLKSGRGNSTDYSIQRLALVDSSLTLHFDVQGVAVESTSFSNSGTQTELDASASGFGDQNGKPLILEGTFQVQGNQLEVVSTAPPPNV